MKTNDVRHDRLILMVHNSSGNYNELCCVDNDGSFFTSIIRQDQGVYDDDASIVNEASSITSHTIADDLGQPCHR